MGLLRAQRADVEAGALKRGGEGGVVDLGVVGEGDEGGAPVELDGFQGLVGPFTDSVTSGKRSALAKAPRGSMTVTS
jgi:hypothetical protein